MGVVRSAGPGSLRSSRKPKLHVAGERQAEIGVERALVEFVEQHRSNAVE